MMALVSKDLWNMRTAFVSMGIFAVVFISIFRDQSLMFMIAPIFFSTMGEAAWLSMTCASGTCSLFPPAFAGRTSSCPST